MYRGWTDEDLFGAVREENCVSCFEALYLRYWKLLYKEAFKRFQDKEDAEDCIQDVFVTIWNNRHKIIIRETFRQYLYKVLFNKTISAFREKATLDKFLTNYIPEQLNSIKTSSGDDELEILYSEINKMPEQMRRAIILSKIEGKSADEIAQLMAIKIQSVRNHIYQGMNRLKKKLKKN